MLEKCASFFSINKFLIFILKTILINVLPKCLVYLITTLANANSYYFSYHYNIILIIKVFDFL